MIVPFSVDSTVDWLSVIELIEWVSIKPEELILDKDLSIVVVFVKVWLSAVIVRGFLSIVIVEVMTLESRWLLSPTTFT